MDLIETLRSIGAVREFTDEPVGDDVVASILDTARFVPSEIQCVLRIVVHWSLWLARLHSAPMRRLRGRWRS